MSLLLPSPLDYQTGGPACDGSAPLEAAVGCADDGRDGWRSGSRSTGPAWCADCRRATRFLADHRIPFEWHDVDGDPDGQLIVRGRNDGKDIIPTIVFPDGSHLSEPSDEELANKLGLDTS